MLIYSLTLTYAVLCAIILKKDLQKIMGISQNVKKTTVYLPSSAGKGNAAHVKTQDKCSSYFYM